MSFLGDIVKSIGTAPPPPPKPPSRPSSANTNRAGTNATKAGPRPPLHQTSSLSGTKRKAEDETVSVNCKAGRPNVTASAGNENRKGPAPPLNAPKRQPDQASGMSRLETGKASADPSKPSPTNATASPAGTVKPGPAKGSYAELMARAKEAAEQRSQNQVGVIKHQDTVKQKPSKFAERRKQEQEQAKAQKQGNGKQPRQEAQRSASPQKKDDPKDSKAVKAASKTGYKGTMGMSTSRHKPYHGAAKKTRYDEYLGTDEEDDSDMADDVDEGGYNSEGSSDMEAGFDDVEGEERLALRKAKEDDAREQELESRLKREKEERRRKLTQMASKRK